jgi:hypothetical protein
MISSVTSSIPLTLVKLLSVSSVLILAGCVSLTGTNESRAPGLSAEQKKAVCALWKGVGWEDGDTDPTITEVKVNNAKRDGFCHGT